MLKTRLNPEERIGLTPEEVKLAEKYLRAHKTRGIIPDSEAAPLLELYVIGTSFVDIQKQFQQYPISQILLTAAVKKWGPYKHKVVNSLKERVQTRIVKSVVDSVDFLTNMLQVAGIEFGNDMQKYIKDPVNNPKPKLKIDSFKEYREALDSLQKLINTVSGSTPPKQAPALLTEPDLPNSEAKALISRKKKRNRTKGESESEAATLLAEVIEDDEED